ncbi:hypothetical protein [Lacticaseibacillus rhamnosus]|uniref:hypothetical protein n=1 Tax=Lacticaseibacillus rhamnosus TaxID=47715 RepID=UPI00237F27AF|nr:hypothetical protein [Lacticaseibacillus rhamnosus]MDE3295895.1 hypothetical protein [Lacticaseibacillus rhamnosus]
MKKVIKLTAVAALLLGVSMSGGKQTAQAERVNSSAAVSYLLTHNPDRELPDSALDPSQPYTKLSNTLYTEWR